MTRPRWIVLPAVAVAVAVAAFLVGIEMSGEFLRAPLERALTSLAGLPARIEGPLRLRTGLVATLSAEALTLSDVSGPLGAELARGSHPRARIDLVALLRRSLAFPDITGDRLTINLRHDADGRANWAPIFAPAAEQGAARLSFGGIDRLRIGRIEISDQREGAAPLRVNVLDLDVELPRDAPTTARASVELANRSVAVELRSDWLTARSADEGHVALDGSLQLAGVRTTLAGRLQRDGSRFEGRVESAADDAGKLLAALGVSSHQPVPLALAAQVVLTTTDIAIDDAALTIGNTQASGSARVSWVERLRVAVDLSGERIDLEPFRGARPLAPGDDTPQAILRWLEDAAGTSAQVGLAFGTATGLPVAVSGLKVDGQSGDGVAGASIEANVSGAPVKMRLDFDARQPERTLAARIDSGRTSSAALPERLRSAELSASAASIRGQLRARGTDARALTASVEGNVEASDLRWSITPGAGAALSGRFDRLRVVLLGDRASSAEAKGTVGGLACSIKVGSGALAPLLAGEPSTLQLAASCPGARLSAQGKLALTRPRPTADLIFDASAQRIGPLAAALGLAPALPQPLAARGTLVVDASGAHARLAALRLGRSAGSGEFSAPLDGAGATRVKLVLTSLDLAEIGAGGGRASPAQSAGESGSRAASRLPDLDFDLSADRVLLNDVELRRLKFAGAMRSGRVQPAPLRFDWQGAPFSGRFGVDLGGASPRAEIDGKMTKADLGTLLGALGIEGATLRADELALAARAAGTNREQWLASADVKLELTGARLDWPRLTRALGADVSVSLVASPGGPATLAARGTVDGEAADLALEAGDLAAFAAASKGTPLTMRLSLGKARLDAAGRVMNDGRIDGQLRLSGDRLDRLGSLLGLDLPAAGPVRASLQLAVSTETIAATNVDLELGSSRIEGQARVDRRTGTRPRLVVELRAPTLHFEDLGAQRWLSGATVSPTGPGESSALEPVLAFVRDADADVTLDIGALLGAGVHFASGRIRASADGGVARVALLDARAVGGDIELEAGVDTRTTQAAWSLRVQARALEYDALARAVDPAASASGTLDLIADLSAQGPARDLVQLTKGTADVAIYPSGLHSDGLAYWGTGVLVSVLGQLDPKSRETIECAVASFDFGGGKVQSTALFVEASRLRIIGQLEVDLATRTLSGRIDPVSRQPQILALAPTMLLGGTIEQPRLSSAPANVVTVPLRMTASVFGFASSWVSARDGAPDGAAGCREAFLRIREARARGEARPR